MPAMPMDASAYTDLARLASLKNAPKQQGGAANEAQLKQVAQEFEALLLGQMLKAMRAASDVLSEGSYLQSNETKLYQEMLDQQLAVTMSRQKGVGLSDVLVRQLSGQNQGKPPVSADSLQREAVRRQSGESITEAAERAQAKWQAAAGSSAAFASPQDFIQRLKPLAETTARRIGLEPLWLLAQAALESGWGRSIIRRENGQSSHNLFGIKAHDWSGAAASAKTTEYENGKPVQQQAKFRAYPSFAHSFADYLNFLQSNPRYSAALKHSQNPEQFIEELQKAGYASDPNYAGKIKQIAGQIGELLSAAD